jgi:hypothetical protein
MPSRHKMKDNMAVFRHLVPRIALALVAAVATVHHVRGQPRSQADRPIIPVIGVVKGISGRIISVDAGGHVTTVVADERTEIWKGKIFHDLSLIQVGDDFAGRCRSDANGRLVAELIELNVVNFFGVITKAGDDRFEMLTNPNADPKSAYEKKRLMVWVDSDTLFTASAKEDIKAGRGVQMVGLDLRNGTVRATRLTVYEGDRPVRMRDGKVLSPAAPPK